MAVEMTSAEMIALYRKSTDPKGDIRRWADEMRLPVRIIAKVLLEAGCRVDKRLLSEGKRPKSAGPKSAGPKSVSPIRREQEPPRVLPAVDEWSQQEPPRRCLSAIKSQLPVWLL